MAAWLGNELTEGLPHGVNVRVSLPLTHGMLGVTVLHLILGNVVWEPCLSLVETPALSLALVMLGPPQRREETAGSAVSRKSAAVCPPGISPVAENCMAQGHALLEVAHI